MARAACAEPASRHLLSEPAIVAGHRQGDAAAESQASTGTPGSPTTARSATRSRETYPEIFHDFNARMWQPGGFHRPLAAREREWKTKTGKANFIVPQGLDDGPRRDPRATATCCG